MAHHNSSIVDYNFQSTGYEQPDTDAKSLTSVMGLAGHLGQGLFGAIHILNVALVTGGNRSIGLETVYMLLRKNCVVWIAGRSQTGFDDAKANLSSRQDITDSMIANLHYHKLDLSEMKPAHESGKDFASHNSRLDILIANAGVSLQRSDQLSSDGYEQTFQVNQLGHFAFITPLLPLLEKTAREHGEARVVITSSDSHGFAKKGIDFEALKRTTPHSGVTGIGEAMQRYGATKLANMLFARELDKRWAAPLRKQGVKISADCVHPGTIVNTQLGGDGSEWGLPSIVVSAVRFSGNFIGFSALEGAMTQTYVATMPEIKTREEHGLYYVPKKSWMGRYVESQVQKPDTHWGEDDELAAKVWSFSEDALNKALAK